MRRRVLELLGLALLCASGVLLAQGGAPGVKPGVVTKSDIGDRWRVFAVPGDYKLQNAAATATVRRRDGWLVDFWRNSTLLPTAPQLGTTADIDAVWQIHPIVRLGDTDIPVMAEKVSLLRDAIEIDGIADSTVVKYRAKTLYRLHPTEPRLTMTTTFRVVGGSASGRIGLGDAVKWGNVDYVVDGLKRPRNRHKGFARWIGRRGAGGDLVLKAPPSQQLWVDYEARIRGFQGTIAAFSHRGGIPANGSVTITRELAFEPLPPEPTSTEPTGTLEVSVKDEAGRPIPAKIRLDRAGHKTPLFSDDGDLTGADRFMWTGNGRAERELPRGRYRVLVTSGIERDAHREDVFLGTGKTVSIDAKLPRVIHTPGWVAGDLHLHQAPSVDADVSLPQRVIAIAAEGVEFAVATDHYVVTDLAPTVAWLTDRKILTAGVQTMAGSEVSTLGNRFGHFNVFPLRPDQNIEYWDTTPQRLFADARKKSPWGVLQVNHPRWGKNIGYFTYFGVDETDGSPAVAGYSSAFDTLEVYNGDDAHELKDVRKVLLDWLHVLGRGHRYAATGSSDSHKLAFLDPGLPRTMIRHGAGSDDSTDFRAPARRIVEAIKQGHSIVTSGPFIDASVAGKGPGETARGVGKTAKLRVVVRAAPWIDVRALEVLEGGRAQRIHWVEVPRSRNVVRLDRTLDVKVTKKTFVVVVAQGQLELPNASREKTQPFAFTNPIWLEP